MISIMIMLTNARLQSAVKVRRRRDTASGLSDDDQGILRCALVMLAVGDAVGAIFVLEIAIDLLNLNY
jgi:hypothetical protein